MGDVVDMTGRIVAPDPIRAEWAVHAEHTLRNAGYEVDGRAVVEAFIAIAKKAPPENGPNEERALSWFVQGLSAGLAARAINVKDLPRN